MLWEHGRIRGWPAGSSIEPVIGLHGDDQRGRRARSALRRHRDRHGRHPADARRAPTPACGCTRWCCRGAGTRTRGRGARRAGGLLPRCGRRASRSHDVPDGRPPAHWDRIKNALARLSPYLRLRTWSSRTQRGDAHQDHRLLAELVPTEFRDHLILGYEILKWETDTPTPVGVSAAGHAIAEEKVAVAARALSVAGRQRLVRRVVVPRPVAAARCAVPQPARRGVRRWRRRCWTSRSAASRG